MSIESSSRELKEEDLRVVSLASTDDSESTKAKSESRERALRLLYLKLDMRIIPALWCLYFLASYGGAAWGNALTMNSDTGHSLPQHTHLSDNDISASSALSTVGFIALDLPMNLIMSIVAPQRWMSRSIVSIGLVNTCIVAVKNARGMDALQFFSGAAGAGVWPGMAYYISMWYPDHRATSRVGYYFTAAQISCAVAGLLAAAFQKMDGVRGYTGYQWNFLIYGVITIFFGLLLMFWLPDRPGKLKKIFPLTKEEFELHREDMAKRISQEGKRWTWRDFLHVILDIRILPLILMYFGVVGAGIAIENYATTILQSINPKWSPVTLSLLNAPIWLFDLGGILTLTPFADRFPQHRPLIFSFSTAIIIAGLFITTFAGYGWSRWGGLLICGFGLGSTVPITMAMGASIFGERHGDLGVAMATALISGVGNTGSVATSYALYSGWPEDEKTQYRDSNMVMAAILGISIIAAGCLTLLRFFLGDFKGRSLVDITFLRWFRGRGTCRAGLGTSGAA